MAICIYIYIFTMSVSKQPTTPKYSSNLPSFASKVVKICQILRCDKVWLQKVRFTHTYCTSFQWFKRLLLVEEDMYFEWRCCLLFGRSLYPRSKLWRCILSLSKCCKEVRLHCLFSLIIYLWIYSFSWIIMNIKYKNFFSCSLSKIPSTIMLRSCTSLWKRSRH